MLSAEGAAMEPSTAPSDLLARVDAAVREHRDELDVAALARELRVPPAALRGVHSFYSDLHAPLGVDRVCTGASCALAGACAPERGERAVHCLGHCDRSPARLRADGTFVLGSAQAPAIERPPPSDVRCLAREPIATRRLLRGDHSSIAAACADGAYATLARALSRPAEDVLSAVERSRLRGRGGAGFSTGAKWRVAASTPADARYVVANGDEGDPGSFVDRELMERDPHAILEGLLLCAYAIGASRAIVFVRGEYPWASRTMRAAIDVARAAGVLGRSVIGGDFACDVELVVGRGSYVCGEETAMLEAIEGRRGEVRPRPPYPAESGLHGRPTVVQNVETLVDVVAIVRDGPERFAALGTPRSAGTKALCLNHGFARPGIVEVELGTTLREVIERAGGGGAGGKRLDAVWIGGPMGSVVSSSDWDVPVCHGAMADRGIRLGHGGMLALHEDANLEALVENALAFVAGESCGKCTPCRLGSASALSAYRAEGPGSERFDAALDVMSAASLCAFGRETPAPILELLELARARRAPGADR